ncbi:MAG: hypothetical protein HY303_17760 [Candidatus Wallbacteria bacterium]|nr:hypothetical protein [Candidatus Wallbacteria bacterium]
MVVRSPAGQALLVGALTLLVLARVAAADAGGEGWLAKPPGRFREDLRLPGAAAGVSVFGSTVQGDGEAVWFATESGLFRLDARGAWTRFGKTEGLPSEVTRSVAIDPSGRAWCGTSRGPAYLEGGAFRRVMGADGQALDADVWTQCHDGARTWVGTDVGLFEVSGGRVARQFTIKNSPLGENWISGVAADGKGNVWVGIWLGGVARFDGTKWTVWRDPDGKPDVDEKPDDGLLSDAVTSVAIDAAGGVFVGTSAGVSHFDGWHWKDSYLGPVQYVEPAREGRTLLVGTPDGLIILEGGLTRRYHLRAEDFPAGSVSGWGGGSGRTQGRLPSAEVFTAAAAPDRIFVGTRRGIAVLEPPP